ncbi:MAG: DNA polymerase III subunit alpha [Candidatus Gastranaerophilales bacterium]|nr:DNA polymerase III subunit alpha [Candidatus Gastranaerophilales bacterium]
MKYVPLHIHTEYSLLDGAIRIPEFYKFAAENDMPAIAITDHGVMYGCADMFIAKNEMLSHMLAEEQQELKKKIEAVKPIVGCEFYVCDGDVLEDRSKKTMYHLVLLAKNQNGYHNLCKLDSIATTQAYYYKPRINHEILEQHCEDLICLSACIQGEVARHILDGNKEEAINRAKYYKNLFGDDFYIELQDHGLQEQKDSNPALMEIAEQLNIKTVITNDSHYLRAQDAAWHDTLLCEQTKSAKSNPNRFKFSVNEFYVKTVDELRKAFSWMDEDYFNKCIETTVEIADKVDFQMDKLEFGKTKEYLPKFPCPEGFDEVSYFDHLCREGLKKRYGDPIPPEIVERYEYEYDVICKMGFPAYFLLTWDFINWAKEHKIPVGPGRGSAAGSIVAYSLGITELDPIEHKLLFERFLNPERISMPDVDIDFCQRRRGEVIDYVSERWGADHVCQIITFGTLAAKAALKAVSRVYEIPFAQANLWAGMIPSAPGTKLKEALADGMELKKLCDENSQVQSLVDEALHMEGLKNQVGTHAAGVIIAPKPMSEIIPVALSKEKSTTTQYPMAGIEKIGLLKMDFLGLETLTIIQDALDLIKARTGKDIDINRIPLNDKETFELLSRGETDAVFQLESGGMKKLVKRLKPTVFEDIGALVALYRPGPIEAGMIDDFVDRKHGRQKVEYAHPLLENILNDTYGTIVYQEQIMAIFQTLAGYTLGGADKVRRMMGKKKLQEMAEQKEIFVAGAAKNDMPRDAAMNLFEQIESFAKYCFNKAHSSAYAFVAYQTAYLKAHYPVEFMCAMLTSVADKQEKTQQYILQCQAQGIEVLPPDINYSNSQFTPDGNNIRFGLASIKNVGEAVIEQIELERKEKPFESFYDFCSRVDSKCLNKRTLESLVKAGAFSNIEKSRKQLLENIDSVVEFVQNAAKAKSSGQVSLFASLSGDAQEELNIPTFQMQGNSDEEFSDTQIQMFEKELMGIYVTSHPLGSIKDTLKYITTQTISDILETPKHEATVTICGLLSQIVQKPTKKDPTKFIKTGTIEDLTSRIGIVAFPKVVESYGALLESDQKVILKAKVNIRDEEVNLAINEVKPIEQVNLVTLKLLKEFAMEENVLLKEMLARHKGENPVVIDFEAPDEFDNNKRFQLLTNNHLWVSINSEMERELSATFKDKLEINVKSLAN